jgi:hypothetical protein
MALGLSGHSQCCCQYLLTARPPIRLSRGRVAKKPQRSDTSTGKALWTPTRQAAHKVRGLCRSLRRWTYPPLSAPDREWAATLQFAPQSKRIWYYICLFVLWCLDVLCAVCARTNIHTCYIKISAPGPAGGTHTCLGKCYVLPPCGRAALAWKRSDTSLHTEASAFLQVTLFRRLTRS